jgi:hypothetical protein
MSKLLTVFGATGQQGGSLINYVLNNAELSRLYHIRGITRNSSKPSALDLKKRGVEVIRADLDVPSTLDAAVQGSYAVFGVTNCKISEILLPFNPNLTPKIQSGRKLLQRLRLRKEKRLRMPR